MWRYDRPGAGRWREFWQSGVELIGPPGPEADAEMLALVSDSLRAIGVRNFYFRISSRKIVDGFIRQAGIPAKKTVDVFRAIDKLDKIGRNGVMSEMRARGIDAGKAGEFMRLVEDGKSSGPGMEELKDIQKLARSMGAGKISTDLSVVRGIDYYTGFVFETMVKGFEKLGSVASGGRYDSLIGLYSGSDVPATGYGMGIDRLLEIVKPEMPGSHVTVFVSPVKDEVKTETLNITQQLRAAGISAETELMGRNIGKQLDYASKKSIPFALIVGPNEIKAKKYTLRDMKTGKESKLSLESVIRKLASIS